ncbi:CRISPR-associated helicase Cas3' [Glycomyces dulcitolivorans]|uniref:CRISPR-associated helicase Cas3' n=1 Tax=Glycomyces dulcitolivorans TaxID=2200759 RepID=UPI0018E55994|nr:CRISPR-associated helicase Cas3' [Glycomyces dulcitolivorans]
MDLNVVDLAVWGKSRGLVSEGEALQFYPLVCHLLDAAAFAGRVWDEYLSDHLRAWIAGSLGLELTEARSFVVLLAGLHDIGKACPGFQFQVTEAGPRLTGFPRDGEFARHDAAGQLWLGAALPAKFGWDSALAEAVAEVVGGHHGFFATWDEREYSGAKVQAKGLGTGPWGVQRTATAAAVQEIVGVRRWPTVFDPDAQVLVCAVVVLADWLASRTPFVRSRMQCLPGRGDVDALRRFFDASVAAGEGELARAGLVRLGVAERGFVEAFGFAPNRLQSSLIEHLPGEVAGPGLLIVTEAMGQGKTEAALYASEVMGKAAGTAGLAFLLPTMATSNAMEERLVRHFEQNAVGPAPVKLVHSMAWLRRLRSEQQGAASSVADDARVLTEVTEWLSGGRKAAFAPVCVGTVDQALLGVLPLKYNAFRMLAFANKTIVIDEVHAFDEFVRGLLCGFLSWCGHLGVPVVLMSATLPAGIARELAAAYLGRDPGAAASPVYPGWVFLQRNEPEAVPHTVTVPPLDDQPLLHVEVRECATVDGALARGPVLAAELEALCRSSGCAAVVCTTVKEAQQTYAEVTAWRTRERLDVDVVLLHSNMPMWQREEVTDRIVRRFGNGEGADRSGRTIIVSTQVIEQSIDIDMDLVISDLAPLELLLQRAGRGHRHRGNDAQRPAWAAKPRLVVLVPEGGADPVIPGRWSYVYPPAALIRTQRLLLRDTAAGIRIPEDVQELVDTLYSDSALIAGHEGAERESLAWSMVRRTEAERWRVPVPKDLGSVGEFSGQHRLTEEHFSTRFDADSVRVLPLFDGDGAWFLDPECSIPLPQPHTESGRTRWRRGDVAAIIERTIPVRRRLLEHRPGTLAVETLRAFEDHQQLRYVVPLPHTAASSAEKPEASVAGRRFRLDPDLGLVIDQPGS